MKWRFLKRGRQRLLFVGQNSSFHGMNRLFNPKANPFSRVFWLTIIITSIGGLYLMMEPVVELRAEINYTPDTLYLDWTTTFPAITVCEESDPKNVLRNKFNVSYGECQPAVPTLLFKYNMQLCFRYTVQGKEDGFVLPWSLRVEVVPQSGCSVRTGDTAMFYLLRQEGPVVVARDYILAGDLTDLLKPLTYNHCRFLTNLLYSRGTCSSKEQCQPCGTSISCDVQWRDIIERIRNTCEEMLSDCSYNGVEFPCCHFFQLVDSEHGPCFSFNTLQHKEHLDLIVVNRTTGPGTLRFRSLSDAEITIHSPEELATNDLDTKLKKTIRVAAENEMLWLFSVVEIENDVLLSDKEVHHRGCRYLHEIPNEKFHTYPVYSVGACQLARVTEEMFAHCGCIHPVRDLSYREYYCNYTGMNCWNTYQESRIKDSPKKGNGMNECLPSCVESDVTTVHFARRWSEKKDKPGVMLNVEMAFLPTLRYHRKLIRTNLDLVVSVGGIAGLFFSASILSFLEIFYLIFRPQKIENVIS